MKPLPTMRAAQLAATPPSAQNWLIEGLWSAEAVGIIGGGAQDLQVLPRARSCRRGRLRYPLSAPLSDLSTRPVLLFAAEDDVHVVRARLEGIAAAAGVAFENLDIHIITVPALRLDRHDDRLALAATVALLLPKLLVLDPFVRLHCIDENVAAEVAPLLGYLRTLQRSNHTAVALVHHARKGAAHERGGQALRGSSEFHAWGDSNLYMRRVGRQLQLSIEHRAAAGRDFFPVALKDHPPAVALEVMDQQPASPPVAQPSCQERIEQVLAAAREPLTQTAVRDMVRMRTSDVSQALAALVANGRVIKSAGGYQPGPSR